MKEQADNRIHLRFKSIGENVSLARLAVSFMVSRLDLSLAELDEITVATSEAVSNAIIHGYRNEPEHMVTLEAELFGDWLRIQVSDEGCGIEDIAQAMEPNFSKPTFFTGEEQEERMGLGFSFMQSFMDSVDVISTVGEGTSVILSKQLLADRNEALAQA